MCGWVCGEEALGRRHQAPVGLGAVDGEVGEVPAVFGFVFDEVLFGEVDAEVEGGGACALDGVALDREVLEDGFEGEVGGDGGGGDDFLVEACGAQVLAIGGVVVEEGAVDELVLEVVLEGADALDGVVEVFVEDLEGLVGGIGFVGAEEVDLVGEEEVGAGVGLGGRRGTRPRFLSLC